MAYVERSYLTEQFEMLLHDDNVMCPVVKVLDALEIIDTAPTAEVAPKSEVDKWYHEYHVIKDALKQEKMYHRETEKLADKYCAELQTARQEVAREIFEEIRREIKAALKSNYSAKQERVEKQIPDDFVSYMCEGKIATLRGIDDFIDELEQKYTEGE